MLALKLRARFDYFHHHLTNVQCICNCMSVETQAILTSLQEQGIEDVYMDILNDIIYGQLSDSTSAQRE